KRKMGDNDRINIDLNCYYSINGYQHYTRTFNVFNGDKVRTRLIPQVRAGLPVGLTNANFRLRRYFPTVGDYFVIMNPDSDIYDHFSANPNQDIVHIIVELLPTSH
ncbi:9616_t:CDS:1, partial [Dentiscutata erythropus]